MTNTVREIEERMDRANLECPGFEPDPNCDEGWCCANCFAMKDKHPSRPEAGRDD